MGNALHRSGAEDMKGWETMNDLISRQAAIAEFSCCELTPDGGIDANYAIDFLKYMPSAQPECPKGKWGEHGECPFCGYLRQWEDDRFCGNCGADMRGEQDE